MQPTAEQILAEVLRVQDQVTEARGEAVTAEAMKTAVADGIRVAVSDPKLWASALEAMQRHAQTEAGGWLLSWIKGLFSKVLLFCVLGAAVYSLGGWSALAALFKGHQP